MINLNSVTSKYKGKLQFKPSLKLGCIFAGLSTGSIGHVNTELKKIIVEILDVATCLKRSPMGQHTIIEVVNDRSRIATILFRGRNKSEHSHNVSDNPSFNRKSMHNYGPVFSADTAFRDLGNGLVSSMLNNNRKN